MSILVIFYALSVIKRTVAQLIYSYLKYAIQPLRDRKTDILTLRLPKKSSTTLFLFGPNRRHM